MAFTFGRHYPDRAVKVQNCGAGPLDAVIVPLADFRHKALFRQTHLPHVHPQQGGVSVSLS